MIYSGNIELLLKGVSKLEEYQEYEIKNSHHILNKRAALIISNHSFIAYDMLFLMNYYYNKTGEILRGAGDHLLFKFPIVKDFFLSLGTVDGNRQNIKKLIENNEKIIIYPGGAKEAMKSSAEKYQLFWEGRYGFIKLAIKYNIPIIPVVAIGVEDIFHVYTDGYEVSLKKIPFPIFKLKTPKKKIIHIVQEPIYLGKDDSKIAIRKIHRKLKKIFQETINKEVNYG